MLNPPSTPRITAMWPCQHRSRTKSHAGASTIAVLPGERCEAPRPTFRRTRRAGRRGLQRCARLRYAGQSGIHRTTRGIAVELSPLVLHARTIEYKSDRQRGLSHSRSMRGELPAQSGFAELPVVSRGNIRELRGTISAKDVLDAFPVGRPAAAVAAETKTTRSYSWA
jgi:hypothetical protein